MTEGLFILTTIFVAYIVYTIIGEQKATAKSHSPAAKPETPAAATEQAKPQAAVSTEKPASAKPAAPKAAVTKTEQPKTAASKAAAPKAAATKAEPPKAAAKPATTKTAPAKPVAAKKAPAVAVKSAGLKDPKTGEVTTAYSNYRFTKRWIKDALVEEGLLEKVYAGKELDAEAEAKIKEAIGKLEAMDKYKA
ncbi:hypothetical protein B0F88_101276 [Methylobacter tundripaludum]|uniref:Uncharacterized protein n=1 Tax=Methylobacter tundripaludum TaxID=173365 RepID=A0A2S6H8E6_9GAMM|nr:hypothetical protein [Methylobacter tundripaludum]PPK73745.1 hypothetical protein B0F88_101276 [Methylobacter tundripaludum]